MKKPILYIFLGGITLGLLGSGLYLFLSKKSNSTPVVSKVNITPTVAPKFLSWDDPAGFTVSYPEGLTFGKHDEDKVNYAHVEFSDSRHPGSLIIWVKDLPKGVTDTVSWGKKAATSSSAISFDTTLGGQPAQKILISGPSKTIIVGVVYDGVLWYVEANLTDEAYWQSVYDKVVQSFVFKPLATQGSDSGGGSGANESGVDEEEILE